MRPELDEARRAARRQPPGGRRRWRRGCRTRPASPLKVRHNAVLGYFVEISAGQGRAAAAAAAVSAASSTARPWPTRCASPPSSWPSSTPRSPTPPSGRWRSRSRSSRPGATRPQALARADPGRGRGAGRARRGRRRWPNGPRTPARCGPRSTARSPSRPRPRAIRWSRRRSRAPGEPFTPNDCRLDGAGEAGARLSHRHRAQHGRQVDLPAPERAAGDPRPGRLASCRPGALRLGVVDRLFSRVGAGDDLARGRSTFMAEMVETAAILTQATPRSFVILDEIGRGTATYDGLAIAWACAEALHDVNRCRALFATHYHELASAGGAAGARLQPVAAGQGVERRPGLPARGRARPGRPLLRRAGGQAGRRAARGGRPRPPGAGPAGERGRRRPRDLDELPLFAAVAGGRRADAAPSPARSRRRWPSSTSTA